MSDGSTFQIRFGDGGDRPVPPFSMRDGSPSDCRDQWPPFVIIEGGAGSIDFDMPVFLAISRQIAAVVDGDWSRRRGDPLAALQQSRLISFDLNDQFIAGLAGDLEGFFGSAWRRA